MIDIKKAEEEFKDYTSKFDLNEDAILRKVHHTFRVEKLCEKIAISLEMKDEEIKLAKLIGILHDIGRFEQYTRYKTYDDTKSIDHGDLGVKILEENSYIREYVETNEYDEIILKAILNHNKYAISDDIKEEEIRFCNIIRDADKLDIMFLATFESWKEKIQDIEKQEISPQILQQILSKEIVDDEDINYDIDRVIRMIAFIYDLNFNESYEIIKENDYINKIIDRFKFQNNETKEQMELVRKIANYYINENIIDEKD